MRQFCFSLLSLLGCSVVAFAQEATPTTNWSQFRGPNRDGVSLEKGLLKEWPKGGPELLWKTEAMGDGFSSVSVVGERIFTMGDLNGSSHLSAVDRATGKSLWQTKIGKAGGNYAGTRCTPTVDEDRVYGLGQFGDLVCLNVATGEEIWRKNMSRDFGGQSGGWNYTESPLVDGNKLVCTPGGAKQSMVALDKTTGKLIWSSALGQAAGYSSMIGVTSGKFRQYVQLLSNEVVSVDSNNGQVLWRYGNAPGKYQSNTANIPTPIVWMDRIYAAAGYGRGAGLVQLTASGSGVAAKEVYFNKELANKHGGAVRVENLVFSDRDDSGNPQCADIATGKILWKRPRAESRESGRGSASMVFADGHLYIRYDNGWVALVEANSSGYVEKGSFKIPNSSNNSWAHPVVVGGKLFLREKGALLCYNVTAK